MVRQLRSIWVFSALAALFALLFSATALLIESQQREVQQAASYLQNETVGQILQRQRLGRNLEQLRNEGEKLFSARTPGDRQQALILATLVSRHQSVQEHAASAALAQRAAEALATAERTLGDDPLQRAAQYDQWQGLAQQLSLLADDVMTEGANLMTDDLQQLNRAAQHARYQLLASLFIVGTFILGFMVLLRNELLQPLARIHKALARLDSAHRVAPFPPVHMREILAIESAIERLQNSMADNEVARRQLEEQAHHDTLTGLSNRRHFFEQARLALLRSSRLGTDICVGMADLDFFKHINDTYGHAAGDEVLRQCAQVLQDNLRATDLLCRFGGEEFAFLLADSPPSDALVLAERIRATLADHPFCIPGTTETAPMTISIGLAQVQNAALEPALNAADRALYTAKANGRNQVQMAAPPDINGATPDS